MFGHGQSSRFSLVGVGPDNPCELSGRRLRHTRNTGGRRLDHAHKLGPQLIERRQVSKRLDTIGIQYRRSQNSAQNNELVVGLGKS